MSYQLINGLRLEIVRFIKYLRENIFIDDEDIGNSYLVELLFENIDGRDLMNKVVTHLLPWKKQIEDREESFFHTNRLKLFVKLLDGCPPDQLKYFEDQIDHFSKLLGSDKVTPEKKEVVFKFFTVYVVYAEEFKKVK